MTICVLYCNEPPEGVDSCSAKSPKTIVMKDGESTIVCGKIFFSECATSDDASEELYLIPANTIGANTIPLERISYYVEYYDTIYQSGTIPLTTSNLFQIRIEPFKSKYGYLKIVHRDGKCAFPIVVCS